MSEETTLKLSSEQQEAVSRDETLIVRAGAGSGKTEVLARRFVALLAGDLGDRGPLDPVRLAALTFTEKAALDMRERIASVLAERIDHTTDATLRQHLRRAERTLGLARISTIHAFCARVLRENAVAAGLDPDFEVLDDYESIIFYERVCREILVKAVREGDRGALALVQARRLENDSLREDAQEIVRRILTEARRRGDSPEVIRLKTERYAHRFEDTGDCVAPLTDEFAGHIDALVKVSDTSGATREKILVLRELWRRTRRRVRKLNRLSTPADIELLREILGNIPTAQSPKVRDFVKAARELVEIDKGKKYGLKGRLIAAWGEYRGIEVARLVARLIARAGEAIEEAERMHRVMTFDGLLVAVRDLFRGDRRVVSRYRRELSAILVDEYQDTNNVQDEIIRLLTDPALASDASVPQLFIVGDEKQSIYRFRGADVSVFNQPRCAAEIGLSDNRRSTSNILAFANDVAKIAMAKPPEPRNYRTVWSEKHELRSTRRIAIDFPVEFITRIDGDAESDEGLDSSSRRSREGKILGGRIRQIIDSGEPIIDPESGESRPTQYRDCVILMRAFGDIAIYEQALAAAGVPTYTVKGRGFYGRPEVKDLISLLNAIADPRDSLAVTTVLRSPFFALSDDCLLQMGLYLRREPKGNRPSSIAELFQGHDFSWLTVERSEAEAAAKVLRKLREMRDREPAHVIVERSLELSDYESVMAGLAQGDQRIANLRKVMEIARSFDTHRFFTFHDFVSYLNRLVIEEPYEPQAQLPGEDDDVVRLMTVHQAKGLEFPIVIIADAGRKPPQNNATPLLDAENGLLMCATDGSGYDEIPNAAVQKYRKQLADEEEAESARVLYVALTRARDRLIISEGANKDGWSKYFREFIGNQALAELDTKESIEIGAGVLLVRRPSSIDASERPARTGDAPVGDAETVIQPPAPVRFAATGERVISPTALADFARCPRQYWLRHGLGLPEHHNGAVGGESDALAMGSVAHAVLERIQFGLDREPTRARIAQLTDVIGARAGLNGQECEQIVRDLAGFARIVDHSEEILGREVPFMLNAAPGLFIRGQIDVVLRTPEQIIVRDYKYASKSDIGRYEMQLECYALAVAERFPTSKIVMQIALLRDEASLITLPAVSTAEIRAKIAGLGDQLALAAQTSHWQTIPKDRSACSMLGCAYILRCWNSD